MTAISTGSNAGWTNDAQFQVSDPDGTYGQAAVTLNYLNYSVIIPNVMYKYATVTGVDMKTTGQTTLYAVPNTPALTGLKFYVTDIIIKPNTISGFTTAPTIQIGKSAGYNEYLTATDLTGLDTVGEYKQTSQLLYGLTIPTRFDLGDTIKVDVTIGATGTTITYDFILFGIYL